MQLQQSVSQSWYEEWFDSDFYHILYKERDEEEAKLLLDNLQTVLQLNDQHAVLDLACGRGRHANYLAAKGLNITGLDLSASSIAYAKKQSVPGASFHVHDMRESFGNSRYHIILNLFTSFGYFEHIKDNLQVMHHISDALLPGGKVVIEYLNPLYVRQHLVHQEIKKANGIEFSIQKEIYNGLVYKHIRFIHEGKEHSFTERVMLITLEQFTLWFAACGLQLQHVFGNYELSDYRPDSSSRMILVAKKDMQ